MLQRYFREMWLPIQRLIRIHSHPWLWQLYLCGLTYWLVWVVWRWRVSPKMQLDESKIMSSDGLGRSLLALGGKMRTSTWQTWSLGATFCSSSQCAVRHAGKSTSSHPEIHTMPRNLVSYLFFASVVQYLACLQLGITFTAGTQSLKLWRKRGIVHSNLII